MNSVKNVGFALLFLFVFIVIVGPIVTIWSLNTLFPVLNIPTNIDTWMACVILFGGVSLSTKK